MVLGGSSALAWVTAVGPSVVLLIAALFTARLVRGRTTPRDSTVQSRLSRSHHRAGDAAELEAAIASAIALNSYEVSAPNDPMVRLQAVVRFAPMDYESIVGEIAGCFRVKNVMSIDMVNMRAAQAARLVDFCSGMAAMYSGWIFRVTDTVIVVTPPN